MRWKKELDNPSHLPSVDSGFAEDVPSTNKSNSLPTNIFESAAEKLEHDGNSEDESPKLPPRHREAISKDRGEYVGIEIGRGDIPALPDRRYKKEELSKEDLTMTGIDEQTEDSTSSLGEEFSEIDTPASRSTTKNVTKSENSHVEPVLSEPEKDKTNISEEKSSTSSKNDIECMSSKELSELLRTCKLSNFAGKCVEEGVDGELFLELTDDILKDEPFCLKSLEILKVNKLKTGWKPK